MEYQERIEVCALCRGAIQPKDPRVNFGRKTYHGSCFVGHLKKTHEPPSDESDVNKEDK